MHIRLRNVYVLVQVNVIHGVKNTHTDLRGDFGPQRTERKALPIAESIRIRHIYLCETLHVRRKLWV